METRQDSSTEPQLYEGCVSANPDVQEQVHKYMLDDLEDAREAEAVEEHLLECAYCRETFLTMLSVRVGAAGATGLRGCGGADEGAPQDARLLNSADFKEQGGRQSPP